MLLSNQELLTSSMTIKHLIIAILGFFLSTSLKSQSKSVAIEDIKVSSSVAVKLGHVSNLRSLESKPRTSTEKKLEFKRQKKTPLNFKGRRGQSKAVHKEVEHQGIDPVLQTNPGGTPKEVTPFINMDGIGDFGSPHDPTGDVSDQYYVQMVNSTSVGVFSLTGQLIYEISANTLWSEFNQSSAGDPIVLYDEVADRWILTEFAAPSNLLIAISDDGDPMGGFTAYNFTTPNFPDYPKYSISPDILVLTTNEEGGSSLHNYFFDLKAMYQGVKEVDMQRVEIPGNTGTESGFYVSTPVDWNGLRFPFDNRPMTIRLNDSSWPDGPDQDRIEVFSFDIDFISQFNTRVTRTDIVTAPFDSFPCSRSGTQFACIPQKGGSGLDGIPEVVMNLPHLRNFGSHESMVFSFITDASNGLNRSGIRWVELRRKSSENKWDLFQEGTYAPNDGLDRFLPSIAIDSKGNIGMGYNVSSDHTYVGARFTGRRTNDPLGLMTVAEFNLVDGKAPINSGERFGDYSHMSVAPYGDDTFWWTTEYAGEGTSVTQTRIAAFQIRKDSFDLAMRALVNPISGTNLSSSETVTVNVVNSGLNDMKGYKVDLLLRNEVIESKVMISVISPEESLEITFDTLLDLSAVDLYNLKVVVSSEEDQNSFNDTLKVAIRHFYELDAMVSGEIEQGSCASSTLSTVKITSNGSAPIDSFSIALEVNGVRSDTLFYEGSLSYGQSTSIRYNLKTLIVGENTVVYQLISINGNVEDDVKNNNEVSLTTVSIPSDYFVTLQFKTDFYPSESSWEVRTESLNNLVASGSFKEANKVYSEEICINQDSCYIIQVNDSQGDGICCVFGIGNFNLYDNQGFLLVSNDGDFGLSAQERFCGNQLACSFEVELSVTDVSMATASDGIIMVQTSSGTGPYQFSINQGSTFQDSETFDGLLPGEYDILVKDASGVCQKKVSTTIGITSSVVEFKGQKVKVSISPNPVQDVFKVRIEDLNISDRMLRVQLLSMSGQLLQDRKIGRFSEGYVATFSLMEYPKGTYLFRVINKDFNYMTKIVRSD